MTRPIHAAPDRYEGPLTAELAAMSHDALAVALLAVMHGVDAVHRYIDPHAHPDLLERLHARRRWLTEAARRIRG